jgi:hypothetical protein
MYSLIFLYENVYLCVFYDFESFIDLGKSRCDVPNCTTQGWACTTFHINPYKIVNISRNILENDNFMLK